MKINVLIELRDFLLLWGSQSVSGLGTAMTNYALVIWAYRQQGTATSVTLLTLCSFMPTILFRFAAGAVADRGCRKRIMLLADLAAACGTGSILALHATGTLNIGHLYVVNLLLSIMNAFQEPASFAATSMLVPPRHYARAGGLQGMSGALIGILAPALGSVLMVHGGLELVLAADLISFAVALIVLVGFVHIPELPRAENRPKEPFGKECLTGVRYLLQNRALLNITLFVAATNFLAKLGNDGMLAPFVLARSGSDQQALGTVQTSVALGLMAGSALVTVLKPPKQPMRMIFILYAAIFTGNVAQSLTEQPWAWAASAFVTYMMAAVMNANLGVVLRRSVPVEMHGRVFSARDTLQNCTIPLSMALSGPLADCVFAPLMQDQGRGLALQFFLVGALGAAISVLQLHRTVYRELNS